METLKLVFILLVIISLFGGLLYLLSRFQPQRVKALRSLADENQWDYQTLGGLPRSALQTHFNCLAPEEIRQHGRCVSGKHTRDNKPTLRFYSCDASYVDTKISTQTIVVIAPEENEDHKPAANSWHLLLGKLRQADNFDQSRCRPMLEIDTSLPMALRSDSPEKANQLIEDLKDISGKRIHVEWLQKHLILYKPDHILETHFIPQVIEQAIELYEKLETV